MKDTRKEARPSGPSRLFEATRDKAVDAIREFMIRESVSGRDLANLLNLPEATIRSFLNASHKRRPHPDTFRPLLKLRLGDDARSAVLDFLEFETRVRMRHLTWDKPEDRVRVEFRVIKRVEDSQT